jgi:hypothetical protein
MPVSNEAPEGSTIRILLANLPGVFAQLVIQAIEAQPDMIIMGQVEGEIDMLRAVKGGTDILVLGAPTLTPVPGICSHLLNEYPHLKIMLLGTQEEGAVGYWLGVKRCRIKTVSADSLLDGIQTLFTATPTI